MIISPDFMYKIKCIGMILPLSNIIGLQGTVLLTGFWLSLCTPPCMSGYALHNSELQVREGMSDGKIPIIDADKC